MSSEKHPLVSVLMPVYNTEKYVAEAIESILNQTFADLEFIIIDDGSTDRSLEILRRYEIRDCRIRLIVRENRGIVATRNELINEAKTEIVMWMDSDDISYPSRIEKQLQCFSDESVVWSAVSYRMIDPDGLPIRCIDSSIECSYVTTSMMMRREIVIRVGGFRKELKVCEDRDIALRMSEVGKVVSLSDIFLDYRQHMKSICHSQPLLVNEYRKIVDALSEERRRCGTDILQRGEPLTLPCEELHRTEACTHTYRVWAWWALNAGNLRTARKHAWWAFFHAPWLIASWRVLYCCLRGH